MNPNIFSTKNPKLNNIPATDTVNAAGGKAYAFADEHALAQYALTGCFNNTFYTTGKAQFKTVSDLCDKVAPLFVAQLAVYARQRGYMKDMPAFLVAYLASLKTDEGRNLLKVTFPLVMDNMKMVRNFVQVIRSGAAGRNSLGTLPKRLIANYLNKREGNSLFKDSLGQDPSFADVLKLAHPKPKDAEHEALFAYLLGKDKYNSEALPSLVKQFEGFKKNRGVVPEVPFQMLTALDLTTSEWAEIAKNGKGHFIRMNLNTFTRHDVWKVKGLTSIVANKLRDPDAIRKTKTFPYQLMMSYKASLGSAPTEISNALQDALEIATENTPKLNGTVAILLDVSGSMGDAVTGKSDATSKVRCIDVAALIGSSIARVNSNAIILPFDTKVHSTSAINPRDSIATNCQKLAAFGGGGTDVACGFRHLNSIKAEVDYVFVVSDNASWVNTNAYYGHGTSAMAEWAALKKRCPKAKLALLDINPSLSTQVPDQKDVLNLGGWSDTVYTVIGNFFNGTGSKDHWVEEIKRTVLNPLAQEKSVADPASQEDE